MARASHSSEFVPMEVRSLQGSGRGRTKRRVQSTHTSKLVGSWCERRVKNYSGVSIIYFHTNAVVTLSRCAHRYLRCLYRVSMKFTSVYVFWYIYHRFFGTKHTTTVSEVTDHRMQVENLMDVWAVIFQNGQSTHCWFLEMTSKLFAPNESALWFFNWLALWHWL